MKQGILIATGTGGGKPHTSNGSCVVDERAESLCVGCLLCVFLLTGDRRKHTMGW